jgi:hypothetical protein
MEKRLYEHGVEVMAGDRAAADALPGPLIHIFEDGSIEAGGQKVRKLFAIDEAIFKIIDSPIYKMMLESAKPKAAQEPVDCSDEDEWMLVLQFITPPIEAYKFAKQGKKAFEEAAILKASNMGMIEIKQVIQAIMEQITRAFGTKLNYAADESAEGEKSLQKQA